MATKLLERAFAEAAEKLPEFEQDQLAETLLRIITSEVSAELKWDDLLAHSQTKLERLADRALKEDEADDAKPLDLSKL